MRDAEVEGLVFEDVDFRDVTLEGAEAFVRLARESDSADA